MLTQHFRDSEWQLAENAEGPEVGVGRRLASVFREFFTNEKKAGFGNLPVSRHETFEKGRGHIEIRQASWATDLYWIDKKLREH